MSRLVTVFHAVLMAAAAFELGVPGRRRETRRFGFLDVDNQLIEPLTNMLQYGSLGLAQQ
jgi:hypothetical protein